MQNIKKKNLNAKKKSTHLKKTKTNKYSKICAIYKTKQNYLFS